MYVFVKVIAEAKIDKVESLKPGRFVIYVKAKREKGEANKKVLALLANTLKVPVKSITMINGHKQQAKMFFVREIDTIS